MSDSDIAIRIEGLGKKYTLGETHQFTRNFRETLMTLPRHFGRKAVRGISGTISGTGDSLRSISGTGDSLRRSAKSSLSPKSERDTVSGEPQERDTVSGEFRGLATFSGSMEKVPCPRNRPRDADAGEPADHSAPTHGREEFWALRDINLEIKRGEAVGIIGRNGAGKSTLLKVLSRITAPTTGRAEIHGRVGALLEVGTGMNPELTGRENIYLNGAIIGMRKREIDAKFDEIVDFSGVEKFLDTPLKRYSSGMRVRLGFSVAAHLEPEILIVDEVLSVGDAEFRKKCLGKMDDVTSGGRTVLFVSHNMGAVATICNTAVWMEHGQIKSCMASDEAITLYLSQGNTNQSINTVQSTDSLSRLGSQRLLESVSLFKSSGEGSTEFSYGEDLLIHFKIRYGALNCSVNPVVQIKKDDGTLVCHTVCADDEVHCPTSSLVEGTITFPNIVLWPGTYLLTFRILDVYTDKVLEGWENALRFTVVHHQAPRPLGQNRASVYLRPHWRFQN